LFSAGGGLFQGSRDNYDTPLGIHGPDLAENELSHRSWGAILGMSHSDESAGWPPIPSQERTRWFGDLSQTDFDIEFFERVTQRSPNYVQALRILGELLARKGHYDRSLPIDRRLVELLPEDCVARYNLACSLAMCGQPQDALAQLRQAIDAGYNDFGYLEMDSDLDSLRDEPEFKKILKSKRRSARSKKKKAE